MSILKRRKQDNSFEVVNDKSLPIRLLSDATPDDDDYVVFDKGTGAKRTTIAGLFGALLTTVSSGVVKLTGKYIDATGVWDSTLGKTQRELNNSMRVPDYSRQLTYIRGAINYTATEPCYFIALTTSNNTNNNLYVNGNIVTCPDSIGTSVFVDAASGYLSAGDIVNGLAVFRVFALR